MQTQKPIRSNSGELPTRDRRIELVAVESEAVRELAGAAELPLP